MITGLIGQTLYQSDFNIQNEPIWHPTAKFTDIVA
jgi:hypothetical protein